MSDNYEREIIADQFPELRGAEATPCRPITAAEARAEAARITGKPWAMDYSGPKLMLPTRYGEVEVTFTSAGHAHVSAYSDGSRPGDIKYRGKHWHLSVHVYAEHGWGEGPEWVVNKRGNREYTHPHQFTVPGDFSGYTVPKTYRAAIMTAITGAVAAFTVARPDVLTAAERNRLEHELGKADTAWTEAESAVAAAKAEVRRLHEALDALDAGL